MQTSVNGPRVIENIAVVSSSLIEPEVIRVLHVDDDASLLEISKTILMDMDNFEIDHAICVDEALKKLEKGNYNVVVSDYEMPQKNGLQFLRELKEQKYEVPFILFTGKGREEIAIQALNLGANGYFNKQGSPETVYGELAHGIRFIVENRRAKQALQESESKFKAYIENSPVAIFVANAEANYEYVNDAACKLLGYSKDELLRMSIPQIVYKLEPNSKLVNFEKTKETGYAFTEVALKSKSGDPVYVKINSIKLPDGKLLAYCENITEQKKAVEDLRQKYEVLERVGESVGAGLAIISKEYDVVWANKALMALGVASNKKCFQTFNNLDQVCPDCGVKKVFEENKSIDIHEFKAVDSHGKETWIELRVTPLKDEEGNVIAGLELAVPINERKKNEVALRSSEERFRTVFERAFEGILAADMKTKRFVFANPAICKLTGYSLQELLTMGLEDIHPKENLAQVIKEFSEINEGKKTITKDIPVLRKDGTVIFCDITGRVSNFENKACSVGFFRDNTERKLSEKALRDSQTRFKNLIETTGDFIWEINTQGRFTYCSPQMEKMWGFKPEEMIGKSPFEIMLPKDKEKTLRAFRGAEEVATPFSGIETATNDKFGRVIFIETNGVPFFDEHGVLLGFRGISRDITERKLADEAFRKSEKKYRELADSLPDIVFEVDVNGLLTFVNERAYEISGYSHEDFEKGLNILLFIDLKEKGKATKNIQKLLSGCNSIEKEYQFLRKDGTTFPALILTAAKLSENKVTGFRGLIVDITERKKIEEQLKKNEKHLREIISNAPIGIATSDSNMYFLTANMMFCNILGYSEDELRKLTFKDITVSGDVQESILNMEKLCSGEIDFFSQEKQYIRKDKVTIDGRVTVSAIRDKEGKPTLFIAQMEDITERKKTQQMLVRSERKLREYSQHLKDMVDLRTIQLKDANERLVKSERFAAIGELAGMVGHDLRNPLAGIKNATYFLKKKGSALSEEQTRAMLENIEKGIDHSDKIINDLLEYAGEIHLKPYSVPAYNILENILCMIKVPEAVKIINEIPDNLNIRVDQNKVERVFINLIKNAIDAMPNGGTITIKCKQTKDNAEISFTDTGTGIPDEVLPKLFNPLFTTKAQGMGFGLAICKRVVEAHGGTITVETARGKGTTFKVSLPIEIKTRNATENTTQERVS